MPPPPAHRAKHALGFSVAGLVLLGLALYASQRAGSDSATVFAGRNDHELAATTAKLLFGASGVTEFLGIVHAFLSLRLAKRGSLTALGVAVAWLGLVLWWLQRSG